MIGPRGVFHSNTVLGIVFVIGGILNVVAGVITLRKWWRYAELRPSFFAIMPDGLWFTNRFDRTRSIPWERVKSATSDWLPVDQSSGRMMMIHLNTKRRIGVHVGFMSSVQVHEAIARIMSRVEKPAG